jgi:hypothetical protein
MLCGPLLSRLTLGRLASLGLGRARHPVWRANWMRRLDAQCSAHAVDVEGTCRCCTQGGSERDRSVRRRVHYDRTAEFGLEKPGHQRDP